MYIPSPIVRAMDANRPIRRRPHAPVPRHRQIVVRLSDQELDAVREAAARDGVALGAWMGELAMHSADRAEWSLGMSRREVIRQLVRVRLDVSMVERAVAEFDATNGARLLEAVLRRLDALIDHSVDDPHL